MVERNHEVSTVGSCVWDRKFLHTKTRLFIDNRVAASSIPSVETTAAQLTGEDTFPPFASLTNDEDRERKAELKAPGTYHIVVNPASFLDLEEHSVGEIGHNPTTKGSSGLLRREDTAKRLRSPTLSADNAQDPDIVILRKFEDNTRRLGPWPTQAQSSNPRAVPLTSFVSASPSCSTSFSERHNASRRASTPDTNSSVLDTAIQRRQDDRLLSHYRNFVREKTFDRWFRRTMVSWDDRAPHDIFEPLFDSYPPVGRLFRTATGIRSVFALANAHGLVRVTSFTRSAANISDCSWGPSPSYNSESGLFEYLD